VLDVRTGEVLVLSSHPAYDPNTLDADWDALIDNPDAPLLNRATQGVIPWAIWPGWSVWPVY